VTARERLAASGFELPAPPPPKGAYLPFRWCGDQLWISGATARRPDTPSLRGVVGADVTVAQAAEQARLAALNLLGAVEAAAGLDAVRLVHLRGYVRGTPDFDAHPAVIDGASQLMIDVLGRDRGAHARTAVGVASLPGGACVELELVADVER
jgi:enamine deaminase RidA (YjgF/YER057c/UK114 family)